MDNYQDINGQCIKDETPQNLSAGQYTNYIGLVSERAFSYECAKRGVFCVLNSQVWLPFDSIIMPPGSSKLYSVQTKSTQLLTRDSGEPYTIARVKLDRRISAPLRKGARDPLYKVDDFDFLHIHLRNYDQHYLIPSKHVVGKYKSLYVFDSDFGSPKAHKKAIDVKKYKKWFKK